MDNPYAPPSADRPQVDRHPGTPPTPGDHRPSTPHQPPPGNQPPRPEPSPAALEALARQARLHLVLVLAALVTVSLPLPWSWAATAFAVWAAVAGVRTLSGARRARVVGLVPFGVSAGLAVAMLIVVNSVATVALWPLPQELQTCQREALTVAARATCLREYEDAVAARLPALGGVDLPGTIPGGPTPAGPGG